MNGPNSLSMSKCRHSVASRCAADAVQNLGVPHSLAMASLSPSPPLCAIMESITVARLSVPMLSTAHRDRL